MAEATTQFFNALDERGHDPRLAKVKGSLRFDVTSRDRRARWLVTIDQGNVAVSHRNAKADCVIRGDQEVFDAIAEGKMNAMVAVLRGLVDVEGDAQLLVFFQRLFPAPGERAA